MFGNCRPQIENACAESPAAPLALVITPRGGRRRARLVIPPPCACGTVLGSSWSLLGAFLGPWGGLEGDLGRSWTVLGCLLGGLGAILEEHFERSKFRSVFGWILVVQRVPRGCQKGGIWAPKMDPKSIPKRRRISKRKNCLLQSSWVDFGSF